MQCETNFHSDIKYFPQVEGVFSPLQGQGKQIIIPNPLFYFCSFVQQRSKAHL